MLPMGTLTFLVIQETLDVWPEKFSEGELSSINEERDCDRKEKIPWKNDTGKIFTLREFVELLHDIKSEKNDMLEANSDLERNRTVC